MEDGCPDRYKPHCDGQCDGMTHKDGGRVATMVMYVLKKNIVQQNLSHWSLIWLYFRYCTIPEKGGGGATNFKNAGIRVTPRKGAAAFFSYIDPKDNKMDKEFTTHSGFPVILGKKNIAVQWVRLLIKIYAKIHLYHFF